MDRLCVCRVHRVLLGLVLMAPSINAQQIDVYSRPVRSERMRQYDVLHYKIRLRFEERTRSFEGETEITLKPLADGFTTCVLDAETFQVSSVKTVSGVLGFEQTPGKLTVHLGRPYRTTETVAFTVSYRASNVMVDSERYGMPKSYRLGLDFKSKSADHPQLINTLSFPEGARHWFPCYDHPSDKATSEVIATVDTGYEVISNGTLVRVTEDQKRREKTFYWRQDQPHSTYLFALIAGPYVKLTDSLGPLPIGYWVYEKDAKDARRSFLKTPEIIDYFTRELGYPYPWPKYDQITIPELGGGAESTNATVVGDRTIHDEKAEKDFPSHWLVAHEAAHQWWGDLLTMKDWSHAWLNESFATYSEYLYSKYSLGEDEGALNLLAKKNQYLAEAREKYKRPIVFERWQTPNENFDRHSYQKGAVVLAMLRSVMGDQPFRRAIASYLKKFAYQSVDTRDFTTAVRESSGQNLDWFFAQWIYQAGHPVLDISYTWDGQKVQLRVVQKQMVPGRIPVFQMPVTIGVTTNTGKRTHAVWLRKEVEVLELECTQKPLLVRFDEGNVLLKEWQFTKTTEELLYQLSHDDVIGRMDAAFELARVSNEAGVAEALRRAAVADAFWAVRRDAVQALASNVRAADTSFLKERAADRASAVRVAAFRALGDRKDATLTPFLRDRFAAEDSYLAQAEALRAIGKCGGRSEAPFLRKAANMKSPNNVLASAATAALNAIGE